MSLLSTLAHNLRSAAFGGATNPLVLMMPNADAATQIQLKLAYKNSFATLGRLPFEEVGFKVFSQADEDGILLYIFSLIGAKTRLAVELCAGDGIECNSSNLIINHGWHALLLDGNPEMVKRGEDFYRRNRNTYVYPPKLVQSWITKDNVNQLIRDNGFSGEVDLLTIDMDGVDYWIWDAINVITPRVLIVEYQDIAGPELAVTVPYKPDFNASDYPRTNGMPNFCGASLPAFVKLGKKKGYRLVGCNKYGYNAFFIHESAGLDIFPEIPITECFRHPKVIWGMKNRFPLVKDLPWVEV